MSYKIKTIFICFVLTFLSLHCFAEENFLSNSTYSLCFTPAKHCTNQITKAINQAQKQILLQSLSFTSYPIAKALKAAQKRGVVVKILLDRRELDDKFSMLKYCRKYGMDVLIDYLPAIAHNKVIIIDDAVVVTGSFNFTKSADVRNAENVLIIKDAKIARLYSENWQSRAIASVKVEDYYRRGLDKVVRE